MPQCLLSWVTLTLTDYCHAIVPCSDETCTYYCQKNNYKNFDTYCKQGRHYPICCCRVPDA